MQWDRKGARKALKSQECYICGSRREIQVVVTMHGKKDLHFPCCSEECAGVVADVMAEVYAKKMG